MIDPYIQQVLRVIVAQICQTIGWHSIQTTPLELLVDILHKYLLEITRNITRYTELYNRIEPNLDDVGLVFRELNINLQEIEEYVNYVQPIPCNIDIPKFPIHKASNLNFLKPGSKEVITRRMYIFEHLPAIYPEKEDEVIEKPLEICDITTDSVIEVNSNQNEFLVNHNKNELTANENNYKGDQTKNVYAENQNVNKANSGADNILQESNNIANENNLLNGTTKTEKDVDLKVTTIKTTAESCNVISNPFASTSNNNTMSSFDTINSQTLSKFVKPRLPYESEGRPTREISSVMMTSSGFISPAREGKLPECKIPVITEPRAIRTPSPPPPPTSITSSKIVTGVKNLQTPVTESSQQSKSDYQNVKQEKNHHLHQTNISTSETKNSKTNSSKSKDHHSQLSNHEAKYRKKLKKKNLLALEKDERKLEKLNKNISVSKQLFMQKQQQKLLKQQQKQLLKLQKQQKQQKQQKLAAISAVESFERGVPNPLNPMISNSDVIMPTAELLSGMRPIPKLSKKHKGLLRKQRDMFVNMIQNRKNTKDEMAKLILHSNEKSGNLHMGNTTGFNMSCHKDNFDKKLLPIQHHNPKKLTSLESSLKTNSIIAQQQALVAQFVAAGNNITDMPPNIFNQTGNILPSGFTTPALSLLPLTNIPPTPNLPVKQHFDDVKIANESDKGKLNVMKKIPKKELPDSNLSLDQFIHLPSGTTITPAPDNTSNVSTNLPIHGQMPSKSGSVISHVGRPPKLPTDTDQIIYIDDDDNNTNNIKQNIKLENVPPRLQQQCNKNNNNNSSNQIIGMNPSMLMVSSTNNQQSIKAEKKLKRKHQQNEPLNLSNDKVTHPALLKSSNSGATGMNVDNKNELQEFYLEQQMRIQQQYAIATKMMKKERKKPKLKENKKNMQANLNQQQSPAAAVVLAAAHQQYIQNLAVVAAAASSSSTPTNSSTRDLTPPVALPNENLVAINRKLMKIDTVMQPSPSIQANVNNAMISPQSSNTVSNVQDQQKSNQPSISATANALTSLAFPYPPFPYSFPSRPGLIPTPGIFPPLSAAAQYLPMMSPFSKFNSMKSTNSNLDEINKIDTTGNSNLANNSNNNQQLGVDLEKNYCNVAPLVSESMIQNFKVSPTKSNKQSKQKSPSDLVGIQKSSELRHSNNQTVKQVSFNKTTSHNKNQSVNLNKMHNNINDAPIEISDDEKIRSDSEEKFSQSTMEPYSNPNTQIISTSKSIAFNSENQLTETNLLTPVNDNNVSKMVCDDMRKPPDQVMFTNTSANLSSLTQPIPNTGYSEFFNNEQDENKQQSSITNTINSYPNTESSIQKHEKRKEHHKKNKKTKEGKIKKKKDKKDKSRNKEKSEKKKDKMERLKDKEKLKKQKKEKKKEKLRQLSIGSATSITSGTSSVVNAHEVISTFEAQTKTNPIPKVNDDIVIPPVVTSNNSDLIQSGITDNINGENLSGSALPKLTLILGVGKSPTPESFENNKKMLIKSHETEHTELVGNTKNSAPDSNLYKRELSPELARISPLVTRPPKQKSKEKDKICENESSSSTPLHNSTTTSVSASNLTSQSIINSTNPTSIIPNTQTTSRGPGRPKGSGNKHNITSNSSSNLTSGKGQNPSDLNLMSMNYNQHAGSTTAVGGVVGAVGGGVLSSLTSIISGNPGRPTNLNSTDADGNQVWICPACGRVDDGTPMIGCDGCDAWYHWVCVGIQVPPDDSEDWYCRVCIAKKQATHESDKKKKRKKKNKQTN